MNKEYFKDFKLYFILKGVMALSFLLSLNVYTHIFTKEEYGFYAITLFFTNLFALISSSWLCASYTRFFSELLYDDQGLFNNIFSFSLFVSFFMALIFGVLLYYLDCISIIKTDFNLVIWGSILVFFQSVFTVIMSYYTASRRLNEYLIYLPTQFLLGLTLSVLFIKFYDHSIKFIFLSNCFSYVVLTFFVFNKDIKQKFKLKLEKLYLIKVLKYGLPLVLLHFLAFSLISSDQLILRYFEFNEEIGAYAANYSLIDKTLTVFTTIVTSTNSPILFSIYKKEGLTKTYEFFLKILKTYLIVSIIFSIIFYICYPFVAGLIINKDYLLLNLVPYILMGSFFLNLSNVFSELFTLNKKTKLLCLCYVLPFLISIVGNWIFVPTYGAHSSAVFTAFSYFVLLLSTSSCSVYLINKKIK